MRNRWGVDVRVGHWVRYQTARGGVLQGKVEKIVKTGDMARAYGPRVNFVGETSCGLDDVVLSLGPRSDGSAEPKANPALRETYGQFDAYGKRRFFGPSQNEWAIARGFPFEMENSRIDGGNTPIQFSKTRAYVCVDEDEYGEPVVEVWPIRNLVHPGVPNMNKKGWSRGDTGALGRALNNPTPNLEHWAQASQREHVGPRGGKSKKPSPRLVQRRLKTHHQKMPGVWANPLVRVKVKSPAQRGKAAPDARLTARRKTTNKAPEGFYANPAAVLYCVWRMDANGKPAYFMRAERSLKVAKEYAQSLADKGGVPYGIIKKPL